MPKVNKRLIIGSIFLPITILMIACDERNHHSSEPPPLLYADGELMLQLKNDFIDGKKDIMPLINKLNSCANDLLDVGPFSVMQKGIVPPSGDKHDYISQGPYWWPDTTMADGLPYIRRDGLVNPERAKFSDRQNLHDLIEATELLSKGYFFSDDEKYAIKTADLLQSWFISNDTKMNPNLEYGQGIPGITKGRGIGIIETRTIGKIADAVVLIRNSPAWNDTLDNGMVRWFKEYLNWLLESEKGTKESVHPNNHGTWYDVQAMSLAIFTGQDSIATAIAERAKSWRFDAHIMKDGSQPEELARTVSFNYSAMNLQGLFQLAYLSKKVGVDLWNYKNSQGATLEDALKFLIPTAIGKEEWAYEQIKPINPGALTFHLFLASKLFDSEYMKIANMLPQNDSMDCQDVNLYFY